MRLVFSVLCFFCSLPAFALNGVAPPYERSSMKPGLDSNRGPIKAGDAIKITCSLGVNNANHESKFLENAFSETVILPLLAVQTSVGRFDAKSMGVPFDGQIALALVLAADPQDGNLFMMETRLVYRPNPMDQDDQSETSRRDFGPNLPNDPLQLSLNVHRKEKERSIITWVNCQFELASRALPTR